MSALRRPTEIQLSSLSWSFSVWYFTQVIHRTIERERHKTRTDTKKPQSERRVNELLFWLWCVLPLCWSANLLRCILCTPLKLDFPDIAIKSAPQWPLGKHWFQVNCGQMITASADLEHNSWLNWQILNNTLSSKSELAYNSQRTYVHQCTYGAKLQKFFKQCFVEASVEQCSSGRHTLVHSQTKKCGLSFSFCFLPLCFEKQLYRRVQERAVDNRVFVMISHCRQLFLWNHTTFRYLWLCDWSGTIFVRQEPISAMMQAHTRSFVTAEM